jgi:hypothetical protein
MASIGARSPDKTLQLMVEMDPAYLAVPAQLSLVVIAPG